MRRDSPFRSGDAVLFSAILLLFAAASAQPIDYEDVANLLPTAPQTTNETLAAVVKDPVVQDAVQNAVGNGSLEGLVVRKKVLIMPATEPTKVVSQREQVLVVPMTHLEDVRKNITGAVNAATEVDGRTTPADAHSLAADAEDASHVGEKAYTLTLTEDRSNTSRRGNFYEALDAISERKPTRKPIFSTDDFTPRESPKTRLQNPGEEAEHYSATISVPIIALLDPARISGEKIDVPIAAMLSKQDDTSTSRLSQELEDGRDEIQRNVQDYVDEDAWSVSRDNWRLASSPSQAQAQSAAAPHEPAITEEQSDVSSENSLPVVVPGTDIVKPLFWTLDADVDYPKDSRDMDVAADIVFRPLFRFRQEAQQRSWRRGADDDYRRPTYQRYNSYPRRDYRYKPRYSDDYY